MRKLGKYNVKKEIGRGGMAKVYLAHFERKPYAIKVLREEAASDPTFVKRFRREASILKELDHKHIVALHEFDDTGTKLFLVMDYIKGESIAQLLSREKKLSLEKAWPLMDQILDALDYAHQKGIIHRDIKPENILIDKLGQAQVTDFGIAAAKSSATLTQTGTRLGTPAYMSPEQIRGQHRLTPQADLYSTGVLFYELLSGQLPFSGNDIFAIGYQQAMHYPKPLAKNVDKIPESLDRLLLKALEKRPSDRPLSAKAMLSTLREIRSGASPEINLTWEPDTWKPNESIVLAPAKPSVPENSEPSTPLTALVRLGLFLLILALLSNVSSPSLPKTAATKPDLSITQEIARLRAHRLALLASSRLERRDLHGALTAFGQALDQDAELKPIVAMSLFQGAIENNTPFLGEIRLLHDFFTERFPTMPMTALLSARVAASENDFPLVLSYLVTFFKWPQATPKLAHLLMAGLPGSTRFALAAILDKGTRKYRLIQPRIAKRLDELAIKIRP